jgi:hypothetical protein
MTDHTEIFTSIYETCTWGDNATDGYKGSSGSGSAVELNIDSYIPYVIGFITLNNVKSVVDIGCGDWRCGSVIYKDLPVNYTGIDVYESIIKRNSSIWPQHNWLHLDVVKNVEKLPGSDLLIIKDVLQHWSNFEIFSLLDHVIEKKLFKYIIICNCSYQAYEMQDISHEEQKMLGRMRPLTAEKFPLRKYNPHVIFKYSTKEISLIKCGDVKN